MWKAYGMHVKRTEQEKQRQTVSAFRDQSESATAMTLHHRPGNNPSAWRSSIFGNGPGQHCCRQAEFVFPERLLPSRGKRPPAALGHSGTSVSVLYLLIDEHHVLFSVSEMLNAPLPDLLLHLPHRSCVPEHQCREHLRRQTFDMDKPCNSPTRCG